MKKPIIISSILFLSIWNMALSQSVDSIKYVSASSELISLLDELENQIAVENSHLIPKIEMYFLWLNDSDTFKTVVGSVRRGYWEVLLPIIPDYYLEYKGKPIMLILNGNAGLQEYFNELFIYNNEFISTEVLSKCYTSDEEVHLNINFILERRNDGWELIEFSVR